MKKYDKYKDSGIEWIGEIPSHWEIKRIRYVANIFGRIGYRGYTVSDLAHDGDGAITINPSNMKDTGMDFSECTYLSWEKYEESPEIKIFPDDILFVKTGSTYGKSTIVRHLPKEATINPQIVVLKEISCNNVFLWYSIKSPFIQLQVEETVVGGTIPTIAQSKINNYTFPLPSLAEQTAIATYLDRKTAEIDELIADKKRLLELYEEEKTAIINQAVTGKDRACPVSTTPVSTTPVSTSSCSTTPVSTPSCPTDMKMKDSGIEWLGEIPEHWEVKKLKYVASINDEVLTEKTKDEYEIEYVEISGVKSGLGIIETLKLRFKEAPSRARRIVRDGDILVSTVRTYLKSIAKIDCPPDNLIASTGFAVIRPRNMDSDYAGFLFYSEPLIGEIISMSTGVSYPAINSSQIGDIKIPLPPLEEQQAIVNHIETECARIDAKIIKAGHALSLLTEYRTALISEVVTGKIKVTE